MLTKIGKIWMIVSILFVVGQWICLANSFNLCAIIFVSLSFISLIVFIFNYKRFSE